MGRRGRPDWIRRHRRLRMFCLRSYALLGTAGDTGPDGGLRAIGRSRGGAARHNLFGTAGRRPNRDCGPRRGPRRKLPGTMQPSHIDCGPIGTRAVRGLRERRAGACIEPEQAPQGTTGRGLGRSRGPRVDRRSGTITERSRGRRTRRSNCQALNSNRRSRRNHRLQLSRAKLDTS